MRPSDSLAGTEVKPVVQKQRKIKSYLFLFLVSLLRFKIFSLPVRARTLTPLADITRGIPPLRYSPLLARAHWATLCVSSNLGRAKVFDGFGLN